MTPERKKKLRTLLRKKAVEEIKKEQVKLIFSQLDLSFLSRLQISNRLKIDLTSFLNV
jgi:hypothetical protein